MFTTQSAGFFSHGYAISFHFCDDRDRTFLLRARFFSTAYFVSFTVTTTGTTSTTTSTTTSGSYSLLYFTLANLKHLM